MKIKNPYPDLEHREFPKTFLKDAEFSVKFSPICSLNSFHALIVPFVKNHFNTDIELSTDSQANNLNLFSEGNHVNFNFNVQGVSVKIRGQYYSSYETTVAEFIKIILQYLKAMPLKPKIESIRVNKINLYNITSKNLYEEMGDIFKNNFKGVIFSGLEGIRLSPTPYPLNISREINEIIENNINNKIQLSIGIDEKSLLINLGFVSETRCDEIEDIEETFKILNLITYHDMISSIGESIIEIMEDKN